MDTLKLPRQHTMMCVFGVTHVGMKRAHNEDNFLILDLDTPDQGPDGWLVNRPVGERGVLVAVSDGMGGAAAGEVASEITVGTMRDWVLELHSGGPRTLIKGAVERANRAVLDAAQTENRKGMGATVTAVLVRDDTAHIATVGDSRAYLIRGREILQLTRDQTYVQMLIDHGVVMREDAEHSPYRSMLLQAMGQAPEIKVAIGRLHLRNGDRLVVCSDGLTNEVTEQEIHRHVVGSGSLSDACDRLVALANERGGRDNITVVVAVVSGESRPQFADGEERGRATLSQLSEFKPGG